jgi:5-methylcytosine-specific restriction protein A
MPSLTLNGYCGPCNAKREARHNAQPQREASQVRYDKRWAKVSRLYRDRYPLCVRCEQAGKVTPGDCVDHIVPIDCGGSMYDESNLQTLCHACHVGPKQIEDNKLRARMNRA